jgi:hypothetical protein
MKTRGEAEAKLHEMSARQPMTGRGYYTIDRSPITGAWRVLRVVEDNFPWVAAS